MLQFGGFGTADGQLKSPHGITTHNGRVYVADYGNHRISVFQHSGQFCISFGSDQLRNPIDVAVNVKDQLLVTDYSHNCIFTFTLDGQDLGRMRLSGSKQSLNNLYGLVTDLNGFVLVIDCNQYVSVFDHLGKFVHCFGNSKRHPFGIALSPNGKIYVCDSCSNQIQIFTDD